MSKKLVNMNLYKCAIELYSKSPFYYDILMATNYIESTQVDTVGVRVTYKGLEMIYNPKFIDSLSSQTLEFVIKHELLHFISNHHLRLKFGNKEQQNIVMDMIINSSIMEYDKQYNLELLNKEVKPFFIPKEYTGRKIFEELFLWMKEKEEEKYPKDNNSGSQKDNNSQGNNSPNKGNNPNRTPMCDETEKFIDAFHGAEDGERKTFDVHLDDEVSEEMRESVVKELIQAAKARGTLKGGLENIIGALRPARVDYLKEIKRELSASIGTRKHDTWQKESRRIGDDKNFLIKGFKRKRIMINVIHDTSGSMGNAHELILSYIYQNGIEVNYMQCDTEVEEVKKRMKKKQMNNIVIKGNGGTILQPAINKVKEEFNEYNTVILTDGYTDVLDFDGIKGKVLILSIEKECEVKNTMHKVKQIVIPKEQK